LLKRQVLYFEIIFALVLLLLASWILINRPGKGDRPNIVLIIVDTLRADRLGCYGYDADTSPVIDKLSLDGVLCENVFAQRSITWASVTSIMTSQYPAVHRVRENGAEIDPELNTLAKELGQQGYVTAAFLGNMLTANHPGFQEMHTVPKLSNNAERDVWVTDTAIDWIHSQRRKPFLMWLHYMAPHKPYEPPEEYWRRFDPDYDGEIDGRSETLDRITLEKIDLPERDVQHVNALYDACVRFTDDQIRRVLSVLEEAGLSEDTIVILTADHGEELYERNHYFYHGCSMYDSALHIPLIIRWPTRLEKGIRTPRLLESMDLAPTVLELLSIPAPESYQGNSFASAFEEQSVPSEAKAITFSEWQDKMATVRTDRWRYVSNPEDFRPDGNPYNYVDDDRRNGYFIPTEALYDMNAEKIERQNVIDEHPEIAHELRKETAKWIASLPWKMGSSKISEDSFKEIQGMGYVGKSRKKR